MSIKLSISITIRRDPSLDSCGDDWAEARSAPQDQGGEEKNSPQATPTMLLSSRPSLEARPMLGKASAAEPFVTGCGGDHSGYVSLRTCVAPPARGCPARGKVAQSSAVRETVPPTARAGYKTARTHRQLHNHFGGDGFGKRRHQGLRNNERRRGRSRRRRSGGR